MAAFVLSSPVVGSSRNTSPGVCRSSMPMLTRLFSPPEIPLLNASPMKACATLPSPSCSTTSRARCCCSCAPVPRGILRAAWNSMYSHTVEVPGSTSSCVTYPESRRRAEGPALRPLSSTSPATVPAMERPARMSRSVVFPAPEGPRMAVRPSDWPALPEIPERSFFSCLTIDTPDSYSTHSSWSVQVMPDHSRGSGTLTALGASSLGRGRSGLLKSSTGASAAAASLLAVGHQPHMHAAKLQPWSHLHLDVLSCSSAKLRMPSTRHITARMEIWRCSVATLKPNCFRTPSPSIKMAGSFFTAEVKVNTLPTPWNSFTTRTS